MTNLFLILMLTISLAAPLGGNRNRPPVAVDDQYFLLYFPASVVEIPVLENDTDPDGDTLSVTALPVMEGGKAEIVDGKSVRVFIDWPQGVSKNIFSPVAYGSYVVSDGKAFRKARWAVWFFPEIPPVAP